MTPPAERAEAVGLRVLSGFDLFLGQAFDAFEAFTGTAIGAAEAERLEAEMWDRVRSRQRMERTGRDRTYVRTNP